MVPVEILTGSWWSPVLILLTITGSAVFPPLPSETMLVTATTLALAGKLNLVIVVLATTVGGLLGDLTAYTVGRVLSRRARHRAHRSARARRALRWLDEHQTNWGPGLIVAGRFVPGGTTAVGISAGILAYPLRRFVPAAAVGACLWTVYGLALAALGRAALPGNIWASIGLAIVLALTVGALVRVGYAWRSRRKRRHNRWRTRHTHCPEER